MDIAAVAISALVFFVLGVIFQKYAVNEAKSVKTHITNEFSALRADLVSVMQKDIQKVSSKL
jgi:hypothetical protein